jgi:hypothetical protein
LEGRSGELGEYQPITLVFFIFLTGGDEEGENSDETWDQCHKNFVVVV